MKTEFKTFKINSANKVVKKSKLLTISHNLANSLRYSLRQMLYLSFGKKRMLLIRSRQAYDFLNFLLKMKKNHGVDFTVSWMKACYVALQKSLGKDNLESLRELQSDLPLPRLINGVPYIIGSKDRDRIRRGDRHVIIFWSSLFSIYRVLKVSYKLKFSTITDPFKGDREEFDKVLTYGFMPFFKLEGFNHLVKTHNLSPTRIPLLRAASATNSVSWHGLFTDAVGWFSDQKMFSILQNYYSGIRSMGWNTLWIEEKVLEMSEIGSRLSEKNALRSKCTMVGWFGQFSLKEEAAGKLRIFAIVDSLSQTMLLPLHEFMLKSLRLIPNDGTFDQDESVKRSQQKSLKAGLAFSFDLSAATDRLPVELTERILSLIFSKEFASSWRKFMVERPFYFTDRVREQYGLESKDPIFYSVGQPMGALSSWPALALTHHWILQYCSNVVLGRIGWETAYEILGDDLVVFDKELAYAYLRLCKVLGIEINLNKSIRSLERPVFEFAKRTCWGNNDVSPVSMKQLLANDSLSERITNTLSFLKRGLIVKKSILGAIISKVADSSILTKSEMIFTPLLSILGALRNQLPHRWLVEPLINPKEDWEFEDSRGELPLHQVINLVMSFNRSWVCPSDYPYSQEEIRKEIYEDYEPEFANVIANTALTQLKVLQNNLQKLIRDSSRELVAPNSIKEVWDASHPGSSYEYEHLDSLELSQIEGWFDDLLFEDGKFDVDQAIEDFESFKPFYYRRLTLADSEELHKKVESFLFHFTLSPKERDKVDRKDEAKVMRMIDKVISRRPSSYFKLPLKEWELVN